jgi:hypothetical protein
MKAPPVRGRLQTVMVSRRSSKERGFSDLIFATTTSNYRISFQLSRILGQKKASKKKPFFLTSHLLFDTFRKKVDPP